MLALLVVTFSVLLIYAIARVKIKTTRTDPTATRPQTTPTCDLTASAPESCGRPASPPAANTNESTLDDQERRVLLDIEQSLADQYPELALSLQRMNLGTADGEEDRPGAANI